MNSKQPLTTETLIQEAALFATLENQYKGPPISVKHDGKSIGTYLEQKFRQYLQERYTFQAGNSASGIDFPGLGVDIKTTSILQPQSSCPFASAWQKVYGLGYALLIFVYEKPDKAATVTLQVRHVTFVQSEHTGDYKTTTGLIHILEKNGSEEEIIAFLVKRKLLIDDNQLKILAQEILRKPPLIGHLTLSNALQWRLQYGRAIKQAGRVEGSIKVQ